MTVCQIDRVESARRVREAHRAREDALSEILVAESRLNDARKAFDRAENTYAEIRIRHSERFGGAS